MQFTFPWPVESLPVCPFSISKSQFICFHRSHAEQELKRAANRFVLLIYIIYMDRPSIFLLGRKEKVAGYRDWRWSADPSPPLDGIFVCVSATKECDSSLLSPFQSQIETFAKRFFLFPFFFLYHLTLFFSDCLFSWCFQGWINVDPILWWSEFFCFFWDGYNYYDELTPEIGFSRRESTKTRHPLLHFDQIVELQTTINVPPPPPPPLSFSVFLPSPLIAVLEGEGKLEAFPGLLSFHNI